jgi:hypothetical protein
MGPRKRRFQANRLLQQAKLPKPARPATRSNSAKLARAVDLFVDYQASAGAWVTTTGVLAHSPAMGSLELTFPLAPETLSTVVGDCLQNLRAALDHEVYRESEAFKGAAWPGLAQAQFPIHGDAKSFPRLRGSMLGGLRPRVANLLQALQPFAEPVDPLAPVLELLHLAARIDRHRLLHVAAAQPKALGPYKLRPELGAVEGKLVVRLELIDFVEQRLMNLDVYAFLQSAIAAVDATILSMVEAERGATAR